MTIPTCPHCGSEAKQVKAGSKYGRQQYQCSGCRRRYVPDGPGRRFSDAQKEEALAMRERGCALSEIGEALGVSPRTLRNWFRASSVPPPEPEPEETANAPDHLAHIEEAPAKRRVTIHDVAKQAGVAVSTVSNFLNAKGRMSEATRERIQDAIDELNFTPSALTRAIRQRRTRILGVMTFGLRDLDEAVGYSIIPPILTGINQMADEMGRDLLMYTGWSMSERYSGRRFLDGHIDGMLWVGPSLHEPVLEETANAGLPVVAVLSRHLPPNIGYINADNIQATEMLVKHLVSLGRRRIGYYGPLTSSNYIDRYASFGAAMAAAGLEWDPSPMALALRPGEPWKSTKEEDGLYYLLAMADRLDAMVLPNDSYGARIIRELQSRGIRVPDDVAVVGFDDVPDAATAGGIGLTTIRQPFREMGRVAVERLIAMIEGAPVSECRISLPAELIVRGSTAGPGR